MSDSFIPLLVCIAALVTVWLVSGEPTSNAMRIAAWVFNGIALLFIAIWCAFRYHKNNDGEGE